MKMSDAVENAFLLLLGQITLITSAILFGVPHFLINQGGKPLHLSDLTVFFFVFVTLACFMMIANIIIGWSATRTVAKSVAQYSQVMFVADILILVCFFSMNNVIMFSLGDALTLQSPLSIQKAIQTGISEQSFAITSAALYFLTALFLLACKFWNYEYYKLSKKRNYTAYEIGLWVVILVEALMAAIAILVRSSLAVQIVLFVVWLAAWIFVNVHWLFDNRDLAKANIARKRK